MPRSNVVITGLGVVSSIGMGAESYFQALLDGRSGIRSLADRTDEGAKPGAVSEPAGLWIGSPIIGFDPKQYVRPRKALKVMCREIQTAFAASQMAVENANLSEWLPADSSGAFKPDQIGVVFGSEMFYGPPVEMEDAIRDCMTADGRIDSTRFGGAAMKNVMPLWMLKYLPNMPACHIGIALNAQGPNNSLILGDVSGPSAVIEAASCLQRGIADVMISGATGTRINTTRMNYTGDLPLAEVAEPISQSSRPHRQGSVGVVGGEGSAALILETPEHADQRGAKPLATLVSYASRFVASGGMQRPLRSREDSDRQARGSNHAIRLAMEAAVADADLAFDQIAMVVSHGSGDPVMDAAERIALEHSLSGVPVCAPIAAIGHTGAACGAMNLATAVLALQHDAVPPTIGHGEPQKVSICDQARPLGGDHVICLSHTAEGSATAMVLQRNTDS